MIRTEGFKKQYLQDVLYMSKRNGFEDYYDYPLKWTAMLSYEWDRNLTDYDCPYKHGMVVFDDDRVVGYLGGYYSRQSFGDKEYIYCNATRWMLDKEYRKYLFKIINEYLGVADIITDFSASESVLNILVDLYGFKCFDNNNLRFFPIPYYGEKKVDVTNPSIHELPAEIEILYRDHARYGMSCIRYTDKNNTGYALYKKFGSSETNSDYIRIMHVSNRELFSKHTHEIIWNIQKECFRNNGITCEVAEEMLYRIKNNLPVLCECDESLLLGEKINHPCYIKKPIKKLMLNKLGEPISVPGLLYSEDAVVYIRREEALREKVFENIDWRMQ